MRKSVLFLLLLVGVFVNSQAQEITKNEVVLHEDEQLLLTLIYSKKADIGDEDWLKLKFTNKSKLPMTLKNINYRVNKEEERENGEKYIRYGALGQGNKFFVLHYYHDLSSSSSKSDYVIQPDSFTLAWRYLTNYASVLADGRGDGEKAICANFEITVEYQLLDEKIKIESGQKAFCFEWRSLKDVPLKKLSKRLENLILKPPRGAGNYYVPSTLMKDTTIVATISTENFIQGVLNSSSEMATLFLYELANRGALPNDTITAYYKNRLQKSKRSVPRELRYYWDNVFLDDLLQPERGWHQTYQILELHSKEWNVSAENREKVHAYLSDKAYHVYVNWYRKSRTKSEVLEWRNWSKRVKILAISRDTQIINYLKGFLNNETEFTIEDWSGYRDYGIIPHNAEPVLETVRVCDVAFVALLRAYNQIEVKRKIGQNGKPFLYPKIKREILSEEDYQRIDRQFLSKSLELNMFERAIRLTPELKEKIMAW